MLNLAKVFSLVKNVVFALGKRERERERVRERESKREREWSD